ncbi:MULTISPECIES: glycine-rich protein [Streptomyces]|uniref:receptor protein-tyrosine kinase n=1 Tax=Streptomyces chartreusis NRRL 3882 TaxID=1079985 RepID=A0A2N9BAS0_STRCX|nr:MULTISPECIES: glycine-rich protein [Streptomyces]SOR80438.1 Bacterial Ig-like domain (group 1) [Streptomyces chartreusis NRRL 3882]
MHHDSAVLRRARFRRGAAALTFVALTAGTALTGASAATAAGSAVLAGKTCTPTEGFSGCRLFDPTGAREEFKVPVGVTALDVRAWGQGGEGTPFANGGAGGYTAGTLSVTPGERLSLAVGVQGFGDALGGAGGDKYGAVGGNSSGVRTDDGKPLLIAAGGGGGGYGSVDAGHGGPGGGERGQDDTESERGGKGAVGETGGAGGGNGSSGADASGGGKGGAGGSGSDGAGGGGGAGYAGGGGGGGTDEDRGAVGSGAGGSSYVDADRVTGARLLSGSRIQAPAKTDPFWQASDEPVRGGIAEGGVNTDRSGHGRIVFQWKTPAIAELTQVSGTGQTTQPGGGVDPVAVVVRDKAGNPVENASVTFTVEDPDKLGAFFFIKDGPDTTKLAVPTDARGRAQSAPLETGSKEGEFTIRAEAGGVSTVFTVKVKESAYTVSVAGGDDQRAEQGEAFEEALRAHVVKSGATAPAGTEVEFRVEDDSDDAPRFEDGKQVVRVRTDDSGKATAPTLTAGEGTGTYTVAASVGDAMTQFAVEVVEGDGAGSPSPSPTTDPSPSADPSPSPSASPSGTAGTTGGTGSSTTGGTSTNLDSGSLASTGAGGIGILLAAAAALATAGFVAFRLGPRLKLRSRDNA